MKEVCPVCSNTNLIPTICRENLVTMQNYVYRYADEARHAKVGKFVLMICPQCGFSYNASFNNNLLQYNENYDNSVPSQISETYYREVASFLYKNFPIEHGLVIDIGCGKGSFLKILCEKYPTVKGVGIDPSYELSTENSSQPNENISFIQDFFKKEQINQRPSLIICRHVIEHIYYPVDFMTKVYLALSAFRDIPIFVEVPDLEWILNQNAFWDFCYEHCNYFTVDSFNNIMELSGFAVEKTYKAFNRQYIWLKAITKSAIPLNFNQWKNTITNDIVEKLQSYAKTEKILVDKMRYKLQSLSDKRQATSDKRQATSDKRQATNSSIAVWGMATKGVIFSNLVDPDANLIDYCIDVNLKKQGCFVPHTAHKIYPPEILNQANKKNLVVIVMNLNYLDEIRKKCDSLSLKATFLDANAKKL